MDTLSRTDVLPIGQGDMYGGYGGKDMEATWVKIYGGYRGKDMEATGVKIWRLQW